MSEDSERKQHQKMAAITLVTAIVLSLPLPFVLAIYKSYGPETYLWILYVAIFTPLVALFAKYEVLPQKNL
ncbi:hypothetical protein [Natronoglycomyces albus]|uniref:Uncharacterized protein n=1 Tax=Natronoglycomyces albus TaxID=2811108 RepID=A0A895XJB1_9ACTN|nr:hypothetical protein [Natronoglycomyces albus]QSB05077.1 hypothetical protein JQS30_15160 [Natronoglycomyces albus]